MRKGDTSRENEAMFGANRFGKDSLFRDWVSQSCCPHVVCRRPRTLARREMPMVKATSAKPPPPAEPDQEFL